MLTAEHSRPNRSARKSAPRPGPDLPGDRGAIIGRSTRKLTFGRKPTGSCCSRAAWLRHATSALSCSRWCRRGKAQINRSCCRPLPGGHLLATVARVHPEGARERPTFRRRHDCSGITETRPSTLEVRVNELLQETITRRGTSTVSSYCGSSTSPTAPSSAAPQHRGSPTSSCAADLERIDATRIEVRMRGPTPISRACASDSTATTTARLGAAHRHESNADASRWILSSYPDPTRVHKDRTQGGEKEKVDD